MDETALIIQLRDLKERDVNKLMLYAHLNRDEIAEAMLEGRIDALEQVIDEIEGKRREE